MKKALTILSVLIGIGAFAAVPCIVGIKPTLDAITRIGWTGILVFLLNASLVTVAPAIGWWILMRGENIPATIGQTLKAAFMGLAINMVTPSAYLGGEPLRTVYIARVTGCTKRRVLATIIVAKVQEIGGLVMMAVIAALVLFWRVDLGRGQTVAMGVVTGVMVLGVAGLVLAFVRNAQPTVKLVNLIAKLPFKRRRMARLRHHAREMEHIMHACFVHRWQRFVLAMAVTMLSSVSNFFRPWLFLVFDSKVGVIGSEHLSGIYFVTNTINLFAFTPGGIGLFESGVLGYFLAAGLGQDTGSAYAMVNRLNDVVFIMFGLWWIVHTGLGSVARGIAKGTDESIRKEDRPTDADV